MTTLEDVTEKRAEPPSAEAAAATELVRLVQEQGLSLTGPDGLLKQFTKTVLETALNEEMTEHLGHDKNQAQPERESTNIRNGTRPKTVLTEASGHVPIDVPRDREGTFEPQIESDRSFRGLHSLGKMESCRQERTRGTRPSCVSVRCGWSPRSNTSTHRSGPQSNPWPTNSVSEQRKRCSTGFGERKLMPASGLV